MRMRNLDTETPRHHSYDEWLRYLVQSSDPDAGELPFLVSMWSCCLLKSGLTVAQEAMIQPYIKEADEFIKTYVLNLDPDDEKYDGTNVIQLHIFRNKQGD